MELKLKNRPARVVKDADSQPELEDSPTPTMHGASKRRINRVKGQLDAVSRMIDEQRYCPDIIYQIRAATNALKALELEILRGHLKGCVKTAFQSRDSSEIESKITEIMKLMKD